MNQSLYEADRWNDYAGCHASVTTSYQLELFREAVSFLKGDVVDCGCGTARIVPFLVGRQGVRQYLGVDASEQMSMLAKKTISYFKGGKFKIENKKIEEINGDFTSAVSIHSFYSWPDPRKILRHIYQILGSGAVFILATPNPKLDMPALLLEAEKELFAHPHFERFKELNLALSNHPAALFLSMDKMVRLTQEAGFKVSECHQNFYEGGVNFLVLETD